MATTKTKQKVVSAIVPPAARGTAPAHGTLAAALDADTPVLLWGPPGVGKTAQVAAEAARRGWPLVTLICATYEPPELVGLRYVSGGATRQAVPDWLATVGDGPGVVLFLDELTAAPAATQLAALRLVHERRAGAYSLPPHVRIVAAANPPGGSAPVGPLAGPLANRFVHVHVAADPVDFVAHFADLWGTSRPDPHRAAVAAYIQTAPGNLHAEPRMGGDSLEEAQAANAAWPSPRSWEMCARLLAAGLSPYEAAAASVGPGVAGHFSDYMANRPARTRLWKDPARANASVDALAQAMAQWQAEAQAVTSVDEFVDLLRAGNAIAKAGGRAAIWANLPDFCYAAVEALGVDAFINTELPDDLFADWEDDLRREIEKVFEEELAKEKAKGGKP